MKKKLKYLIYIILKVYEVTFGRLLYNCAKRYASLHTKLMHYLDWYFSSTEPSSYKHEINLYNWIYDTSHVEFAEGGVFGRMIINKDDNVLDLCCGDGSYSYLFFSDITKMVDAIDYDKDSIKYAKKFYSKSNINYICADLLICDLNKSYYNTIIWRSGSAYFTKENRKLVFEKIYGALNSNGKFYLGTPLMSDENFSANQIEVVTNENDFENEFKDFFNITFKQKTMYQNRVNINYILKKNANKKFS